MWGFYRDEQSFWSLRLIIALVIVVISLVSYFSTCERNPITGKTQFVDLTPGQEIALGLKATPQMIRQYGGLHPDKALQDLIDKVGHRIVQKSAAGATAWKFEFHLLNDPKTVNAFALPGGQVFITTGLYNRLQTEGQLAGVLGHEIGHVVARHSSQRLAKNKLTQGLTGAVAVATGDASATQIAAVIGELVGMSYSRDEELESDALGVRFMSEAGYDPRAMIEVMKILDQATGGARPPEFFSTHPNPENRIQRIQAEIQKLYPLGVPNHLIK
ncbi:MAG: M48 family metallopeptidase [Chloroherpetonaceae bacterium]|nr:M48 family metallopeptidase [Chloroherpetonaceae bacterium]MCS7211794.1 M48 family metallopeptidase [Chloroherpetonaceae bacterium]MDW8020647.1 M48 family metallopeptidase [Chloroherpetonaceae bacterium]MDW8466556.1 M48 family metallopeptidase [Chloroherpetonaceae bacterium]